MLKIAGILTRRYDKVIFATTTPVNPKNSHDRNDVIREYNAFLVQYLKEMGIIINDLRSVVYPHIDEYICDDYIHLTPAGVKACGEQVARVIWEVVEGLKQNEKL